MIRKKGWRWLLLGLAYLALGVALRALTRPMGLGDSETYLQMAEQVGVFTISPHGYRILIPYLAAFLSNLTSTPLPTAFLVLTLSAFAGVNLTLAIWFNRILCLPFSTALLLTGLYVFSYAGIYNLHNAVHVGYWEHWFVLLGFIAIYHERFRLLAATVFLGVWIKETVVLLLPLEFAMVWRHRGLRNAVFSIGILGAIFLSVFLFMRSGLVLSGATGFGTYSSFYSLEYIQFVLAGWKSTNPLKEIYFAFQLLWLIALFGWFRAPPRARRMTLLIPLAVAQILFATDTQRMTVLAFPAILLLIAFLFRHQSIAAQAFLAILNPLAFLLYNFHGRYLLLYNLWVLLWLSLWFASRQPVFGVRLDRFLRLIPFHSARPIWLGTSLTLLGVLALLVLDTTIQRGGSVGMILALGGIAIGTLGLVAREKMRFPISP